MPDIGLIGDFGQHVPRAHHDGRHRRRQQRTVLAAIRRTCGAATFFTAHLGPAATSIRRDARRADDPERQAVQPLRHGRFQINNDWQAYSRACTRARNEPRHPAGADLGPVHLRPAERHLLARSLLQPTSPFYPHQLQPTRASTASRSTCATATSRTASATRPTPTRTGNVIAGVKGTLGELGLGRVGASTARARPKQRINGGFQALLAAPAAAEQRQRQPVRPEHARDRRDEVHATNFIGDAFHGKSKSYGATLETSGEIWKLPAGPLALAFGVEARKEEFDQNMADGAAERQHHRLRRPIKSTRRQGRARSGRCSRELNIPIVKTLEGERRGPLRPLQRLRQHDEPEVQPALAADAHAAGARLVRHGLPRAEPVPALHAATSAA